MKLFSFRKYDPGSATPQLVSICIENGALFFKDSSESIPLDDIELEPGGHAGDKVKIRRKSTGLTLISEDVSVLDVLSESSHALIAKQAKAIRRRIKGLPIASARYWLLVLGSIAAMGIALYFSVDLFVNLAAASISPELEGKLGRLLVKEKDFDGTSPKAKRVKDIGGKLASHLKGSPYKFNFYVKNDAEINAFACPGGYIVVNSGLIDRADSDDELAGVIAHEIGHVVNRDTVKGALHSAGILACIGLVTGVTGQNADQLATTLALARTLEGLSFSRGQESRADLTGLKLVVEAGYKGEALITFFQKLEKQDSLSNNKLFVLLSTHPMSSERAAAIKRELARLKQGT